MASCSSVAISDCKQIKAFIDCIPTIAQGENRSVNIQLLDENNNYLDLSEIEEIYLIIYDERQVVVGEFYWPFQSGYNDIFILQEQDEYDDFINKGLISIEIDSEITLNSVSGGLYSEIRLSDTIDTFNTNERFIGCLVLGKIKSSIINRHLTYNELNDPENWEENRII